MKTKTEFKLSKPAKTETEIKFNITDTRTAYKDGPD